MSAPGGALEIVGLCDAELFHAEASGARFEIEDARRALQTLDHAAGTLEHADDMRAFERLEGCRLLTGRTRGRREGLIGDRAWRCMCRRSRVPVWGSRARPELPVNNQFLIGRKHGGALDGVLQVANVAGPAMRAQL